MNLALEVEHILPVSRGGHDAEENLALACRACNLAKSNHRFGIDPETNTEARLFHPRLDKWTDNFVFDEDSSAIIGITEIGRATIIRLNINAEFQRRARLVWSTFDLYP